MLDAQKLASLDRRLIERNEADDWISENDLSERKEYVYSRDFSATPR